MIPAGSGSTIGDMTSNGGLAAAFDGSKNQAQASSATGAGGDNYIGKDWGAGTTHVITKIVVNSTSDRGFVGPTADADWDLELYGSNSAPSTSTDGTQLMSKQNQSSDPTSTDLTFTSEISVIAGYRYHWVRISDGFTEDGNFSEVEFWGS